MSLLRAALLAAVLAAPVAADPPAIPAQSPPTATPQAEYWLRMYPLQPYAQYWRMTLRVGSLPKDLPKVQAALEKAGGEAAIPVANMASSGTHKVQQLSFRLGVKGADKALKALQRLGSVEGLTKTPALRPGIAEEARDKRSKLEAETAANREALARMPAHSALAAELQRHLSLVERVSTDAQDRILLNLELRESR